SLPARAAVAQRGRWLADEVRGLLGAPEDDDAYQPALRHHDALTFGRTARRSFEVAYWKTIARLAEGRYVNKDNADCVRDTVTRSLLRHHQRDLEALGDYLLGYYARRVKAAGLAGRAWVGEVPFHWRTDFDFDW